MDELKVIDKIISIEQEAQELVREAEKQAAELESSAEAKAGELEEDILNRAKRWRTNLLRIKFPKLKSSPLLKWRHWKISIMKIKINGCRA